MKGIILAGGTGTRLHPITYSVSKQLMPIYDKPMIYYPLATLMGAGIREILIICTARDLSLFKSLLGDGTQLGCRFEYTVQDNPNGLAEAFILGEDFLDGEGAALILGDNVFYGTGLEETLRDCLDSNGATVFAYHVKDPSRYGVVDFDDNMKATSIEEKPDNPKSNYAIPGIYFFDSRVTEVAKTVKPSKRGELEITSIINSYLNQGNLHVRVLDQGTAWLDTGTFESLMQASQFVQVIENRQGLKIGSIEEVAYRKNYISDDQLKVLANPLVKSGYGDYLMKMLES